MRPEREALLSAVAGLRTRLQAASPRGHCWLIGSAAAALAGVPGVEPRDLDLLLDRRDAEAFIQAHRAWLDPDHVPADADRFRSRFARFRFDGPPMGAMPVEIMGGLEVRCDGRWAAVEISGRVPLAGPGDPIRLPSLHEQLRLFECFGREKDLAKARLIRQHLAREDASHAA